MGILPLKKWKMAHWCLAAILALNFISNGINNYAVSGLFGILFTIVFALGFVLIAICAGAFCHE